jgi:glycosyltransferase involved in cell wall biosynthesis
LAPCLAGIEKQALSRQVFEVIASDGGSTDDTRAIATDAGACVVESPYRETEPGVAVGVQQAWPARSPGQRLVLLYYGSAASFSTPGR